MASLGKVRFLVIDDNPHMLEIVKSIIRAFGVANVFTATNADDAIKHLRADFIDIIILDYLLGGADGLALLRRVRNDPTNPAVHIPIIMLTSHAERTRVEAARDAGATEFCAKPVVPAALMLKIVEVINRPRHFVRTDAYYGPDRRRRAEPEFAGPEQRQDRSKAPNDIKAVVLDS